LSDIFISYEKSDLLHAEKLAQSLKGRGWTTFWDRTIPAGKRWREIIEVKLRKAPCVIVLWTKASIKSHWVQEEAEIARRRGVLIPILIENVEPPLGFQSITAARLVDWDGTDSTPAFRSLIGDVAALIGSSTAKVAKKNSGGGAQFVRESEKRKHDGDEADYAKALQVFIRYAPDDRDSLDRLINLIKPLEDSGHCRLMWESMA
jgi:hypothetical protein